MKFVKRLLMSMSASILLMAIFYLMIHNIGSVLIFLVVYFPIIFFWDGIFSYASSFVEYMAYFSVFLFWTAVIYALLWVWKK